MKRILRAFLYTFDGFCVAIKEPAFYQEFGLGIVAIIAACFLPLDTMYRVLIICAHVLTMVVELLNTGIEAVVDLVSPQKHPLAKIAKDMGSAAVFFAFVIVCVVWGFALFDAYCKG